VIKLSLVSRVLVPLINRMEPVDITSAKIKNRENLWCFFFFFNFYSSINSREQKYNYIYNNRSFVKKSINTL